MDASHSPEDQSFKEEAAGDTLSLRFLKCATQVTLKCYFIFFLKSILGSTDTWVPVNNSFKAKVGEGVQIKASLTT